MRAISFLVFAILVAPSVPSQASETCVAQDRRYSYEGYSRSDALRACRAESDNPRACYLHRCAKAKPSRRRVDPPTPKEIDGAHDSYGRSRGDSARRGRSGGLTREQQRNINDAILQQRCIAGGACRP